MPWAKQGPGKGIPGGAVRKDIPQAEGHVRTWRTVDKCMVGAIIVSPINGVISGAGGEPNLSQRLGMSKLWDGLQQASRERGLGHHHMRGWWPAQHKGHRQARGTDMH